MSRVRAIVAIAGRPAPWLILALAVVLRVFLLADKNIWLDEATAWATATSPLGRLFSVAGGDIHPPLYYLVLKCWILVCGDSAAALRSLSVASSVASVFLVYQLAKDGVSRGIACAAMFWLAVSPHAIYHSQEARMYAPVTAAVLAACLAYRRYLESGSTSRRALAAYALCVTVALYLHYFAALVLAAIWLHVLFLSSRRNQAAPGGGARWAWRPWLLAHAAIGLMYLPWFGTAIDQIARGQPWRSSVPWSGVPDYGIDLARKLTFGYYESPSLTTLSGAIPVLVLGIGLGVLLINLARQRGNDTDVFFACVALVPPVLALALLPVTGALDLSRYLPFTVPLLVVAAARGLNSWRVRPLYAASVLLVGSVMLLPSLGSYYGSSIKDEDPRAIVAYLRTAARQEPGRAQDVIFVAPQFMTYLLRYLSHGTSRYWGIGSDRELANALAEEAFAGRRAWLVADYRWPGFEALHRDPRFEEADLPSGMPGRMTLFRVRGR